MILLGALLLQAAAPTLPAVVLQPASPRTLTGRFTCAETIYEVQVTAAPSGGAGAVLDRLSIGGKPVDAGSLTEARRMAARLTDVQSIDIRCRGEDEGELSIYGTQAVPGAPPRRARVRGTLRGTGVAGLAVAVQR